MTGNRSPSCHIQRALQLAGVLLILVSGCRADADLDDAWYLEPRSTTVRDGDTPSNLVLELVDSLGAGLIEDGRGMIAISRSGRVAVAEYADCRISVFDLVTRALLFRIGRCGEGPAEFGAFGDLTFVGDSLHVVDVTRRDVAVISPDGEMARRSIPPAIAHDTAGVAIALVALSDSVLAVTTARPMRHAGVGVLMRTTDGVQVGTFGNAPPAARDAADLVWSPPGLCASEGTLVVANLYRSETVAYRNDGSVAWRVAPTPSAVRVVDHKGRRWPSSVVRPPVCTASAVMLRRLETEPFAPRGSTFGEGVIEVRDVSGRLLLSGRVDSVHAEVLFARAAGWSEFFVFNDTFGEVPQLRMYRLRPRKTGDGEGMVQE